MLTNKPPQSSKTSKAKKYIEPSIQTDISWTNVRDDQTWYSNDKPLLIIGKDKDYSLTKEPNELIWLKSLSNEMLYDIATGMMTIDSKQYQLQPNLKTKSAILKSLWTTSKK